MRIRFVTEQEKLLRVYSSGASYYLHGREETEIEAKMERKLELEP